MPQQTPLTVIEDPPSDVTFPPLAALLAVTEDTDVVETVGVPGGKSMTFSTVLVPTSITETLSERLFRE